jgi:hypothetical protein
MSGHIPKGGISRADREYRYCVTPGLRLIHHADEVLTGKKTKCICILLRIVFLGVGLEMRVCVGGGGGAVGVVLN